MPDLQDEAREAIRIDAVMEASASFRKSGLQIAERFRVAGQARRRKHSGAMSRSRNAASGGKRR
jgi:hypothetical protein